MKATIENFLHVEGVPCSSGAPLARWLAVLEEADAAGRKQTRFIESMGVGDFRKTYDLIEARRLAWSLSALYAPGRPRPQVDKNFITSQLLGSDDLSQPDLTLRMPVGTFTVHLAARLQQAEAGTIRICGSRSRGVDLVYRRGNGGVALIEQKERAYYRSQQLSLEQLVRDVKSRVFEAAEGLQAVTDPAPPASGGQPTAPRIGARVVIVGTSPTRQVGEQFYEFMAKPMTSWQMELSRRGASFSPHAMLVFCMAHDIEPTTMVSAAKGRFIDFHLVGGGACDEQWRLVAPVFQKMLPPAGG
jgi:hypothetical protein